MALYHQTSGGPVEVKEVVRRGSFPAEVSGVDIVVLPNAKANSLTEVKLFGGTEQRDILPSEYQRVEYLESTGTQYINTGVVVNTLINPRIVTTFKMVSAGDIDWWGTNNTNANTILWNSRNSASYVAWYVRWGTISTRQLTNQSDLTSFNFTDFHTLDVGGVDVKQEIPIKIDGVLVNTMVAKGDADLSSTSKILIFRGRATGISQFKDFAIYSNNVLIQKLIPCRRNSDNVLGMYDTVTGNFLTNAGTGTFTAGADVTTPSPDTPMDIVSNNGVLKVNSQGQIYTDGTVETVKDSLNNTAVAEMLLSVGSYKDTQEVLNGSVTKNVGIKVLDGSENWQNLSGYMSIAKTDLGTNSTVLPTSSTSIFCTHFQVKTGSFVDGIGVGNSYVNFKHDSVFTTLTQWTQFLADQYNVGTPVIVVYPLATATTETVTAQTLNVQAGNNTLFVTQTSMTGLGLSAKYTKYGTMTVNYVIKDGKLVFADPNIYLQSDGHQYIRTNIYPNSDYTLEADIMPIYNPSQYNNSIIDSASASEAGRIGFLYRDNDISDASAGFIFYNYFPTTYSSWNTYQFNQKFTLKTEKDGTNTYFYVNGVLDLTRTIEQKVTSTSPITLWRDSSLGRIYNVKVYDDNKQLVGNFVPVPTGLQIGNFTVPSNGMFDIVTQTFFGNQGTGEFTIGRDE